MPRPQHDLRRARRDDSASPALSAPRTDPRSPRPASHRPSHRFAPALSSFAVLIASVLTSPHAARAAERPALLCDQTTPLAVAGLDTTAGHLLLAADSARGQGGWLIELTPRNQAGDEPGWSETALYYPQGDGARPYAGSLGPGPVFALTSCGDACLQAVRWADGGWSPLGEPLTAPAGATAHATYDGSGRPWIVLQAATTRRDASGAPEPAVRSWAYHLEGADWISAGSLIVLASGASEAVPAPGLDDAVVSGTGLFRVGEPPGAWLAALPKLGPDRRGVLVPVEGGGAAYVTGDGGLFVSGDHGATWSRTSWTPWGRTRTRIWTPGQDYDVDLPGGDRRGPLPLVWFDHRRGEQQRILLSQWTPAGDWRLLAELAPEVSTLNGAKLAYDDFLLLRPGLWLLLTGCVNTPNGPGLVLRTYGAATGLTRPRFLPLSPGAPATAPGEEPLAPLPR